MATEGLKSWAPIQHPEYGWVRRSILETFDVLVCVCACVYVYWCAYMYVYVYWYVCVCVCVCVKAVYSLSYGMPAPSCAVARRVQRWLKEHACWDGTKYASWRLQPEYVVQDVSGDWCSDFECLEVVAQKCTTTGCVCVWPPGERVQKQTGYCGLGTSGVNVGAKEFLYGRAWLGWAAVSWAWLGWTGVDWTRLIILTAALLTAKQCCLFSFHS